MEEALQEFIGMAQEARDRDEKAALTLNIATCYANLGRFEEARKYDRQAVAISPRDEIRSRAAFGEAVTCWEERKFDESLRILNNMLKDYSALLRTPDFRDLYELVQRRRGALLTEFSRPGEARPILEEVLSFDLNAEDKAMFLYYLGIALFNLGERNAAKARFLELLQNSVDDYCTISGRYYLGIIYSEEGAYARALQEFERVEPHAAMADIDKEKIYGWLARTWRLLGNRPEAERYEKLARA